MEESPDGAGVRSDRTGREERPVKRLSQVPRAQSAGARDVRDAASSSTRLMAALPPAFLETAGKEPTFEQPPPAETRTRRRPDRRPRSRGSAARALGAQAP